SAIARSCSSRAGSARSATSPRSSTPIGPTSSSPSDPARARLSAIVVAFGKAPLLAECLERLRLALACVDGATGLVGGANDLPDGLDDALAGAVVVPGSRELGFAGGVAAGLARTRGDWVALVNDDCLLEERALVELLAAAHGEDVGSVAAQVRFAAHPD